MTLQDLLTQKKTAIVKAWFRCVSETYPPETARFLQEQKDKFANPVGSTFSEAMESLFDELLAGGDSERCAGLIDDIVRIRAVQDFTPADAAGIFFLLKTVIRDEAVGRKADAGLLKELLEIESRIDRFALQAFDIYMKCRERIWEVKYNDFMKRPFVLTEGGMCPSYMLRKQAKANKGRKTINSHN